MWPHPFQTPTEDETTRRHQEKKYEKGLSYQEHEAHKPLKSCHHSTPTRENKITNPKKFEKKKKKYATNCKKIFPNIKNSNIYHKLIRRSGM
jgi:hypothetical protein